MKIQKIIIVLSSILISSCGSVKYGLNIEATKFSYEESLDIGIASASASTQGSAFQIGITEETKYLITRVNFIKSKYETFDVGDFSVEGDGTGYLASIGFKLWKFQPRLIFGKQNIDATYTHNTDSSQNTTNDESVTVSGLGLVFETDMTEKTHIYFSYDILNGQGISTTKWSQLSIGFRYDFALIK